MRNLPGGDERWKLMGGACLLVGDGAAAHEVRCGGRRPGLGGQDQGDERAGAGGEVSPRVRQGLGEGTEAAREHGKGRAAPNEEASRGVGTREAGLVPDPGPGPPAGTYLRSRLTECKLSWKCAMKAFSRPSSVSLFRMPSFRQSNTLLTLERSA